VAQTPNEGSPGDPQRFRAAHPLDESSVSRSGADGARRRPWQCHAETARRGSLAWGFAAFFFGFGGYYLAGVVLSSVLSARVEGFDPAHPPHLGPLLLLSFAPNVLLGVVPLLFSWRVGHGPRADFGIMPTRRDIKIGLTCGAIALGVSLVLSLLMIALTGPPPPTGITELVRGERGIWLFLFALFAFLGAPVTEELLMRGALWGALQYYRVPPYAILLVTALIFAFIHEEAWRMPVLFAGGLAMGAARMITGRVSASMIAHATNNFLPAVAIFFLPI
jgi:membrane protease YdiL (CAAX protease family)